MGIKVARLHAHTKEGVLSRPGEVIKATLKVDAEIVSLLLEAQHPWRYRTVAVPNLRGGEGRGSFITWGGYYHVYDNITACAMWNNYRAIRVILQELIRDTIEQLNGPSENAGESPHHCSLAVECHKAIVRMVEDICASVPFCLGYEMTPEDGDGSRLVSCFPWVADGPVSGSGGLTLMWPLLMAACSGVASEEMRVWISKCLDKIGHSTGINQALAMSSVLRNGMSVEAWLSPGREYPVSVM